MLDFNHASRRPIEDPRADPISDRINQLIDGAILSKEADKPSRQYVGASSIGRPCEREIQLGYIHANGLGIQDDPEPFPAKLLRTFAAGHVFEDMLVDLMSAAGFDMKVKKADGGQFGFSVLAGRLKGHVDGIIHGGPLPLEYPCIWEAKSLNNKSWKDTVAKGVAGSKPVYAAQIAINQTYLELGSPAVFTAINKDTSEIHHELVPFDAKLAQDMSDRAVRIIKTTETGRLLPRSFSSPDHFQCRFCRWSETCWNKLPDS